VRDVDSWNLLTEKRADYLSIYFLFSLSLYPCFPPLLIFYQICTRNVLRPCPRARTRAQGWLLSAREHLRLAVASRPQFPQTSISERLSPRMPGIDSGWNACDSCRTSEVRVSPNALVSHGNRRSETHFYVVCIFTQFAECISPPSVI
jgi:hypothetical protein